VIYIETEDWIRWYETANTVIEAGYTIKDGVEEYRNEPDINEVFELARAIKYTQRSVQLGLALAAIDGPLPFGDMLGFGIAVTGSAIAWIDYFFID